MRVLILGIAGRVARGLAQRLAEQGHQVAGIDARPCPAPREDVEVHQVDLRKRGAEEVFRRLRPQAVVHLATVTALSVRGEERERINLEGTQAAFAHCRSYGVEQMVFVGRHTYYGAAPDSPLVHTEDEPPHALDAFPELADLVAADLYAATALWRVPSLRTALLRVCYTLGVPGAGTLGTYLAGRRVPTVLGYDPLFHFLHETDAVRAVELSLEKRLHGLFNVAGPRPLPLSAIIEGTGRTRVPLPSAALRLLTGRAGLPALPSGALEHLKYPIVVDASLFRAATGFVARHDELQTLALFRAAC
jgi:UDP-glucose 4-epimerase